MTLVQFRKAEGGFFPADRDRESVLQTYVDGGWYEAPALEKQRSRKEHNQFFAMLPKIYAMLPDEYRDKWDNVDQMRAKTLIQSGWSRLRYWPCLDVRHAVSTALFGTAIDPLAIIETSGPVLRIYTARSMVIDNKGKKGGMTAEEFRKAKSDCLEIWANAIGCSVDDLVAMAGRNAA